MKTIGALSVAASLPLLGQGLELWPTSSSAEGVSRNLQDRPISNPRLAGVSSAHFFSADREIYETIEVGQEIIFGVPDREGALSPSECVLKKGVPGVSDALAAKFEDSIRLFHCKTEEGGELHLISDRTKVGGLHASFFTKDRRQIYVDSAQDGTHNYLIYDTASALLEGTRPEFENQIFEDIAAMEEADRETYAEDVVFERDMVTYQALKYKLAPLTNAQYSSFHGNTVASVMTELIVCLSRVNGLYARDLGLVFEFIDDAELGICLNGDSRAACSNLGNNLSVLNIASSTLTTLGVPYASYDIGHVFTTGSGGAASLRSLCSRTNKARGTTGLRQPFTDVFYIDYVAHEIGHQLNGGHIFRDCNGANDGNLMTGSAAEPGSGATIMGYAGICGNNDIQDNSDPYFNSLNVEQMRGFIDGITGCGEVVFTLDQIATPAAPQQCNIPVGNFFQLMGESDSDDAFFNWERVDFGYEDFSSSTQGNFRSFKPTASKSRFFPNLHAINFPTILSSQVEQLPTVSKDVTFRFTERQVYESDAVLEVNDVNLQESNFGDLRYIDTEVSFTNSAPISITGISSDSFANGEQVSVSWTGGGSANFDVLIATNTMTASANFDHEVDVKDLDWQLVATTGRRRRTATFTVPVGLSGPANLMVRSTLSAESERENCYYFDLITGIDVNFVIKPDIPQDEPEVPVQQSGSSMNAGLAVSVALFGLAVGAAVGAVVMKRKEAEEEETDLTGFVEGVKNTKPKQAESTLNAMFVEDTV